MSQFMLAYLVSKCLVNWISVNLYTGANPCRPGPGLFMAIVIDDPLPSTEDSHVPG